MANVTFNYCSQSIFNSKKSGSKLVEGGLYFITDSGRLYRATGTNAAIVYSNPFEIVNDFPVSDMLQGCLYIHATTHEVRIYNGSNWQTVIPATSTVFAYKGSCTYAQLVEKTTGNVTGDVWNVTTENATDHIPAGTNYAWNGTEWDPLGGSVDLSSYLTASVAASTYLSQTTAAATYATKDVATQSAAGLMSASDKTKLDGLGSLTWTEVSNS